MRISNLRWVLSVTLLLLAPIIASATDYPAKPSPGIFIVDETGTLSSSDIERINSLCLEVEQKTTAQMAVLVINSTEGLPVAMYATELGNRWGVGQAAEDNGLLMVVAIEDREVFTATGSGMEGYLPDAQINKIYRQVLVPNFKNERYGNGIYKALQAYAVSIQKEFDVKLSATKGAPHIRQHEGWFKKAFEYVCPGLLGLFILVIIIMAIVSPSRGSSSGSSSSSYWSSSSSSSWSSSSSSSSSSHSSGGGGGFGGGSFSGGGGGGKW